MDDARVTCRYWNLQDCDETKITETTKNILFMFDLMADNRDEAAAQYQQMAAAFDEVFSDQSFACGLTGAGAAQEVALLKAAGSNN